MIYPIATGGMIINSCSRHYLVEDIKVKIDELRKQELNMMKEIMLHTLEPHSESLSVLDEILEGISIISVALKKHEEILKREDD